MREYINGKLYINGYATDDAGRPRTMTNGYSSEDEKEAEEQYLWAKQQVNFVDEENNNQIVEEPKYEPEKEISDKKISNKKQLSSKNCKVNDKNEFSIPTYQVGDEFWTVEYINGKKYIGGYATNEQGEPICYETGYTDEDVKMSQDLYKKALKEKDKYNKPFTGLCL